jgi:hypothetical protein
MYPEANAHLIRIMLRVLTYRGGCPLHTHEGSAAGAFALGAEARMAA